MPIRSQFETEAEFLQHLRLYFAARAMGSLVLKTLEYLAHTEKPISANSVVTEDGISLIREIAVTSYAVADAMLAEREKP